MGYDLHKIGMARPSLEHNRIARNIVINWYRKYGFDTYEAFQEGLADLANTDGLVPDVVFYNKAGKCIVAIEIENNRNIKRAIRKGVEDLKRDLGIQEVFIYDYILNTWYRVQPDFTVVNSDYSVVLDIELRRYIQLL